MTTTAPSNDAPAPPRAPAARSAWRSLASLREAPVLVALALLVLATWALNPRFLTPQGIKDLFLNATIAMLMAAGQSLIIQSEGVDLSVGSILGGSAFLTGVLFASAPGVPIIAVFLAGTALGAAGTLAILSDGGIEVAIPWLPLVGLLAVTLLVGVIASLRPAGRAAAVAPVTALAAD